MLAFVFLFCSSAMTVAIGETDYGKVAERIVEITSNLFSVKKNKTEN